MLQAVLTVVIAAILGYYSFSDRNVFQASVVVLLTLVCAVVARPILQKLRPEGYDVAKMSCQEHADVAYNDCETYNQSIGAKNYESDCESTKQIVLSNCETYRKNSSKEPQPPTVSQLYSNVQYQGPQTDPSMGQLYDNQYL